MSRDRQYKLGLFIFCVVLAWASQQWFEAHPTIISAVRFIVEFPIFFGVGLSFTALTRSKTKEEEEAENDLVEEEDEAK